MACTGMGYDRRGARNPGERPRQATGGATRLQDQPESSNMEDLQCKGTKAAVATGIHDHLKRFVTELEVLCQDHDVRGQYRHLKRSTGLGGRQAGLQQFITDESGVLLRSKDAILNWWRKFVDTLLKSKSPTLNPDIVEQVTQRPTTCATRRLAKVPDPEDVKAATQKPGELEGGRPRPPRRRTAPDRRRRQRARCLEAPPCHLRRSVERGRDAAGVKGRHHQGTVQEG